MNIPTIIFIFIGIYVFLIALGSRLIIPNFGFKKSPLPEKIPDRFEKKIDELNISSKTDLEYLKGTYDFLTSKYRGDRSKTITKFWYVFEDPFSFESGYIPCVVFNYLVRVMLVKSDRFREEDVKVVVIPFNFVVHQYLKVKIDNCWIDIDPGAKYRGISFGKRSFLLG